MGKTALNARRLTALLVVLAIAGAALAQHDGGTLRVGRQTDLVRLDGNLTGSHSYIFLPQVFNTLMRYDEHFQLVPELAESWEVSPDGLEITLHLRQGVTFHSGREFTASDVVFTLERVRDPAVGAHQTRALSESVTSVDALDDATVVLTLAQPSASIFDLFEFLYIVDLETIDNENVAIGTGPFRLEEWVPGNRIRFVRNENYWVPDRPFLDAIDVFIAPDAQSMVIQLRAGALDAVENPPERETARLLADPAFEVLLRDVGSQFYYITANVTAPPTDARLVRQAINFAINRERFVEQQMAGLGSATAIPWPPHSPAYSQEASDAYSFDLERARELLDEAGTGDVELNLVTSASFVPLVSQAEVLQADLARIGVTLNVQIVEFAVWREQILGPTFDHLLSGTFGFSNFEPASVFFMARPFNTASNAAQFTDPAYVDLAAAAAAEVDIDQRREIYAELTDLMLDESFVMPIARILNRWASTQTVEGVEFRVSGYLRLENAYMGD